MRGARSERSVRSSAPRSGDESPPAHRHGRQHDVAGRRRQCDRGRRRRAHRQRPAAVFNMKLRERHARGEEQRSCGACAQVGQLAPIRHHLPRGSRRACRVCGACGHDLEAKRHERRLPLAQQPAHRLQLEHRHRTGGAILQVTRGLQTLGRIAFLVQIFDEGFFVDVCHDVLLFSFRGAGALTSAPPMDRISPARPDGVARA